MDIWRGKIRHLVYVVQALESFAASQPLRPHHQPQRFVERIDPADFAPATVTVTTNYGSTARAEALRIREPMGALVYTPAAVNGQSVVIAGVDTGSYEVAWFDPQSGDWRETDVIDASQGTLVIPVPTIDRDIAAKITLIQQGWQQNPWRVLAAPPG
jgi:hypothetical protein